MTEKDQLIKEQKGHCYHCDLPFGVSFSSRIKGLRTTQRSKPILMIEKSGRYVICSLCYKFRYKTFPIIASGTISYIEDQVIKRFSKALKKSWVIIDLDDVELAQRRIMKQLND